MNNAAEQRKIHKLLKLLSEKWSSLYMDRRWLCAGLSALCFLASTPMGWFRGLVMPMLGVGFIFAIFWFWFIERMGSVSKQAELYLSSPQEMAALKQAALEKQRASAVVPGTVLPRQNIQAQTVVPELPKAPAPTGRAVFNLGQEAPKTQAKPPQL